MKRRRGKETETDRWRGTVRHRDKLSHNISEAQAVGPSLNSCFSKLHTKSWINTACIR